MSDEINAVVRDLVTNVVQRARFGPGGSRSQVVTAYFVTPHGFSGEVEMSLADWKDEDVRSGKVFQAVADLEGPFWSPGEMSEGEG